MVVAVTDDQLFWSDAQNKVLKVPLEEEKIG